MGSYDIVIPARNEERTVAAVVEAAARAPGAGEIVVVDDHSSDGTAEVARRAGARVLLSSGRGSKALAMATGVEATSAEVVVFFDGDIRGATPGHFEALSGPVLDGRVEMCCGIIDYGPLRNPLFLRLPPITGLRAIRRSIFEAVPASRRNGFQIEIMINEVIARRRMPAAIRVLAGTSHVSKLRKQGLLRGTRAHLSMTAELLLCFTFVPLWTYRAYLENLVILPPSGAPG